MKQKEIKILSDDELNEKLDSSTGNLYNTKSTHAVSPLENPLEIRNLRRTIARLKTEISKRPQK
jgi:large subunit ribosomal protein L29